MSSRCERRQGHLPRFLRARMLRRNDDGMVMFEALIATLLTALVMLGFTAMQMTANGVQRANESAEIVTQYAQGVLEKSLALPWHRLGNPNNVTSTNSCGTNVVSHAVSGADVSNNPSLYGTRFSDTVRGRTVEITRCVTWYPPTPAPLSSPASATAGTKRITVTATWETPGSPLVSTREVSTVRESMPGDAPRAGIPEVPTP